MRSWLTVAMLLGIGFPATAADQIVVVGLFKDRAVLEIDGTRRVLAAGERSPEGVLLVSADSDEAILEVDGERRRLALGTHIGGQFSTPEPKAAVQIWPDPTGMYTVSGSINGFAVDFLVDTGATTIAMNGVQARRLGLDYKLDSIEGRTHTASGEVTAYYLTLDRVRIGEIELRDVQAAVIDGEFPREVLLGNSFLNRLEMQRQGQMLELRLR